MQVNKQWLEQDMEQQTGFKSVKEYIKVVYCHPAYLTYIQSISGKMPGWMKHKLESRLLGEISITSVPWTARRSNQSTLKEISPEYSLEGLMLKWKLQ